MGENEPIRSATSLVQQGNADHIPEHQRQARSVGYSVAHASGDHLGPPRERRDVSEPQPQGTSAGVVKSGHRVNVLAVVTVETRLHRPA